MRWNHLTSGCFGINILTQELKVIEGEVVKKAVSTLHCYVPPMLIDV